ncbi:hypothetical protein TI05_07630 [Achromatium sp. WMS3]|nr:hypothetical protein TI05_07630 [Achromatium sp. WMS3]
MSSEALENLTLDDIQERLRNVNQDRAALQRALEHKRQQTKKQVAQEVKNLIISKGHDVMDIMNFLANNNSKNRNTNNDKNKVAESLAPCIQYVDPENSENIYIRGVCPDWMREQMFSHGLDPKNRRDRQLFKKQYLKQEIVAVT